MQKPFVANFINFINLFLIYGKMVLILRFYVIITELLKNKNIKEKYKHRFKLYVGYNYFLLLQYFWI